jgi:hypothetical protein
MDSTWARNRCARAPRAAGLRMTTVFFKGKDQGFGLFFKLGGRNVSA